ncbi:hypothetical protein GBA52_014041 [Prunus armeniaca]|nr:hypothetical protein GBA52_014041 [Prunus armeniaca]
MSKLTTLPTTLFTTLLLISTIISTYEPNSTTINNEHPNNCMSFQTESSATVIRCSRDHAMSQFKATRHKFTKNVAIGWRCWICSVVVKSCCRWFKTTGFCLHRII